MAEVYSALAASLVSGFAPVTGAVTSRLMLPMVPDCVVMVAVASDALVEALAVRAATVTTVASVRYVALVAVAVPAAYMACDVVAPNVSEALLVVLDVVPEDVPEVADEELDELELEDVLPPAVSDTVPMVPLVVAVTTGLSNRPCNVVSWPSRSFSWLVYTTDSK